MLKKIAVIVTYILISFNFNLFAEENKKILKVGLLAPFSGEYRSVNYAIFTTSLR